MFWKLLLRVINPQAGVHQLLKTFLHEYLNSILFCENSIAGFQNLHAAKCKQFYVWIWILLCSLQGIRLAHTKDVLWNRNSHLCWSTPCCLLQECQHVSKYLNIFAGLHQLHVLSTHRLIDYNKRHLIRLWIHQFSCVSMQLWCDLPGWLTVNIASLHWKLMRLYICTRELCLFNITLWHDPA